MGAAAAVGTECDRGAAVGGAVAACAVLAVVSSAVPAALVLRCRAVDLAGVRE
ncbi:hypothetical protein [Streptomyces sp. NPDC093260]|uniref:hypothetical protein n=1 Tax=Streptomyces sp. NPDC093260 TaxID=3155073 RepID=UPI003421C74D